MVSLSALPSRFVARRLGILGGTFDPPHIGHLVGAVAARDALDLDEVMLVVANDPWQKSGDRVVTEARHRLAMVELAADGLDRISASAVEIERGGPSFSIDTVEALLAEGGVEPVLVVGSDAASGLDTWHRADELKELVEVAVLTRPGDHPHPPPGWRVVAVPMPAVGTSSSDLRERALAGGSLEVLVPGPVVAYIRRHGLYSR